MIKAGEFFKVGKTTVVNLDEFIEDHEYIYRYLPMEYMLDIVHTNHMTFINPRKWNDPFDNFIFKVSEGASEKSFTSSLFCQCLTLNPHSQAYWKTYGGSGFSARLKLKSSEYLTLIREHAAQLWIGRMKYMRESSLIEKIRAIPNLKSDLSKSHVSDSFLEAFFYKRKPFEYENEVRLLIKSNPTENGLKRFRLKDNSFIKEIRLDPRMGKSEETAWKRYLQGYNLKVTKSQLFTEKKII